MKIFTESQRMFDSTFNKIIILLVVALLGKTLYTGFTDGFQSMSYFSVVILFLCIALFVFFRVHSEITSEAIKIRITPFNVFNKTIYWNEVRKVEVVQYSAIKEYGGWGYRVRGKGKAINPSGDKGLKIHLKSGNHILLGTRKADELAAFLKEIKR
ncbi:MAG TPA: hypothetical protein VIG94_10925 [Faecalibacter sp.]|uniref:hypothetical protein n=1 Tax=Faecalibacter sp. LW9 TaxID=3103144 RepID=UPI002AFFFD98|nr:hypothetical protein [Faecalibacter sp. LW9]